MKLTNCFVLGTLVKQLACSVNYFEKGLCCTVPDQSLTYLGKAAVKKGTGKYEQCIFQYICS